MRPKKHVLLRLTYRSDVPSGNGKDTPYAIEDSIPRGELIGGQLTVRVAKTICKHLDLSMQDVTYLTDAATGRVGPW